jgi:hypothetical protein
MATKKANIINIQALALLRNDFFIIAPLSYCKNSYVINFII